MDRVPAPERERAAYHFLRQRYRDPDEVHYFRLVLRAPGYKRLVDELDTVLQPHRQRLGQVVAASGTERLPNREVEWSRAFLLWPELKARFDRLEAEFPMACTVEGGRIAAVAAPREKDFKVGEAAAVAQGAVAAEVSMLRTS